VGVVGNNQEAALDSPDEPILFLLFLQDPNSFIGYLVRTAGSPSIAIGSVRTALRETDPRLALIQPMTMGQIIADSPSVSLRRYPWYLVGSFAALALVLATIGLYGPDLLLCLATDARAWHPYRPAGGRDSPHTGTWHSPGANRCAQRSDCGARVDAADAQPAFRRRRGRAGDLCWRDGSARGREHGGVLCSRSPGYAHRSANRAAV
jgi:hypothetical protein